MVNNYMCLQESIDILNLVVNSQKFTKNQMEYLALQMQEERHKI